MLSCFSVGRRACCRHFIFHAASAAVFHYYWPKSCSYRVDGRRQAGSHHFIASADISSLLLPPCCCMAGWPTRRARRYADYMMPPSTTSPGRLRFTRRLVASMPLATMLASSKATISHTQHAILLMPPMPVYRHNASRLAMPSSPYLRRRRRAKMRRCRHTTS